MKNIISIIKRINNRVFILFFVLIYTFSCKKQSIVIDDTISFSTEKYSFGIMGKWTFPSFTLHPSAHFTNFTGMLHQSDTFIWKPNFNATLGLERIAENGYDVPILNEINKILLAKKALSSFKFSPTYVNANKTDSFETNTKYSLISFASMIAPSPDWFIGLSNFNLIQNNKWVNDTILPLYIYDAGTEEGDIFDYYNLETIPQQPIKILKASDATVLSNGATTLLPIAFVRFKRIIK